MVEMLKQKNGQSYSDKIFDTVNVILMVLLLFIFIWPLWFVAIASVSEPKQVLLGEVILLPKELSLNGYENLIKFKNIWIGYKNVIFYTVVGTVVNLVLSVCFAYPLSRKDFMPRKVLLYLFMFTMYFSGGLIPSYLVVRELGLLNTRFAMIIPGAISVYNCLIIRNYFMNSIPGELQEAAVLDGANPLQYLIKVVLPLSKPVIAVVGLYYAVYHWNDFYTALIYLYDEELLPLQSFLRDLLMTTQLQTQNTESMDPVMAEAQAQLAQTLKYCVIIVASVPVLCIYPLIQRYFVKGVMIGAVKG